MELLSNLTVEAGLAPDGLKRLAAEVGRALAAEDPDALAGALTDLLSQAAERPGEDWGERCRSLSVKIVQLQDDQSMKPVLDAAGDVAIRIGELLYVLAVEALLGDFADSIEIEDQAAKAIQKALARTGAPGPRGTADGLRIIRAGVCVAVRDMVFVHFS
jgi:hypothetical protein